MQSYSVNQSFFWGGDVSKIFLFCSGVFGGYAGSWVMRKKERVGGKKMREKMRTKKHHVLKKSTKGTLGEKGGKKEGEKKKERRKERK